MQAAHVAVLKKYSHIDQLVTFVVNKICPCLRCHRRERKKRFLTVPRPLRRVLLTEDSGSHGGQTAPG